MKYGDNYFILLLKYTKPTIYTEHEMYIMVINGSDQQFKDEECETRSLAKLMKWLLLTQAQTTKCNNT